jgi:hypothetical protein
MAKLQSGTRVYGTANVDTFLYVNTYSVVNAIGIYHTGLVNSTSVNATTINASTIALTSYVNAASFVIGSYGTTTGGVNINTSVIAIGNTLANSVVNSSALTIATYGSATGGFAVNTTIIQLGNSTSNATHNTTSIFMGNSSSNTTHNTTSIYMGGTTSNIVVNTSSIYINGNLIANSTGANNSFYLGGVAAGLYVNASQFSSNLANYVNTSQLSSNLTNYINTSANYTVSGNLNFSGISRFNGNIIFSTGISLIDSTGSEGSQGQLLASNGSGNVYWISPGAASVNTTAEFNWTNTNTYDGNVVFNSNVSINAPIFLNGNDGDTGQVLTSNGSSDPYWSPAYKYVNMSQTGTTSGVFVGVSRYYPPVNIMINQVSASISVSQPQSCTFRLFKNNVDTGYTFIINSGTNIMAPNTVNIPLTTADYLTLNTVSGIFTEFRVQLRYTYA